LEPHLFLRQPHPRCCPSRRHGAVVGSDTCGTNGCSTGNRGSAHSAALCCWRLPDEVGLRSAAQSAAPRAVTRNSAPGHQRCPGVAGGRALLPSGPSRVGHDAAGGGEIVMASPPCWTESWFRAKGYRVVEIVIDLTTWLPASLSPGWRWGIHRWRPGRARSGRRARRAVGVNGWAGTRVVNVPPPLVRTPISSHRTSQ